MSRGTSKLPSPVLVTGATGNVGGALVERLLTSGHSVRALVRSIERARDLLPSAVQLIEGDVTDFESLGPAMAGALSVVHAAGLPEQWSLDPDIFDQVNLGGTINVADAALAAKVQCFVHVSTIDVFVWTPGVPFGEVLDPEQKHTAYEQSKQAADRAVVERMHKGLPARFVCPSGVYGPAPTLTPGLNQLLNDLVADDIPMLLPGGLPMVFNRDVADGILRVGAGPVGTRAILSGPYKTLREIAQMVHTVTDTGKVPRVLPGWFAHLVSRTGEIIARRTKKAPLIPAGALHFLECHVVPDAGHAEKELGWTATPVEEAIGRTVSWIQERSES